MSPYGPNGCKVERYPDPPSFHLRLYQPNCFPNEYIHINGLAVCILLAHKCAYAIDAIYQAFHKLQGMSQNLTKLGVRPEYFLKTSGGTS